jgi:DNA-binding XRE family transcriptional regulator
MKNPPPLFLFCYALRLFYLRCRLQHSTILHWRKTAKPRLKSLIVVKINVFFYCSFQDVITIKAEKIIHLCFQCAPKRFHRAVVNTSAKLCGYCIYFKTMLLYKRSKIFLLYSFGGILWRFLSSENFKLYRNKKGNTQDELADILSILKQSVSKWERGEEYPDITLLPYIASYYNVTTDELLGTGEIQK